MRIYKNIKLKTSMSLPPDCRSIFEAIKRAQLQVFTWSHCNQSIIQNVNPEMYGWHWDSNVNLMVPVWFTGPQLPPSFSKKKHIRNRYANSEYEDADCKDEDDEFNRKRRRKRNQREEIVLVEEDDYGADDENNNDAVAMIDSDDLSRCSDESSWEVSDFCSTDESDDNECAL